MILFYLAIAMMGMIVDMRREMMKEKEKKREDKRQEKEMNRTREIEKLLMLKQRDNIIILWTIKDTWKENTVEHHFHPSI